MNVRGARTSGLHRLGVAILGVALAAGAYSCGDQPAAPRTPAAPPASQVLARVRCTATVAARHLVCAAADNGAASAVSASRLDDAGIHYDLIIGGQNTFVTLASSNVTYAGEVFSFDATVTNLIGQALGTTDGTAPAPAGVRVFFESPPVASSGAGTIDFVDPSNSTSLVDGFATFTQTNQAYYQYNAVLGTNQTSPARHWRIHVPATVSSFDFYVYLSAPVQYPTGFVDVLPVAATLKAAATQTLTATVRDVIGRALSGETVTWASSATGVATVNASTGAVTGVGDGMATITATSTTRTGTATVTVSTVAGSTTTIAGSPLSLTVGSTSTITVQAKNGAGTNMTVGGDVVVLNASLGALSAVTDNSNGTYTATLSSTGAGTSTISGTINGIVIGHPGTVTFTPGAAVSIAVNAGDAQTANAGSAVGTAPGVVVRDAFNNPVPGVTVTFSVSGGNGSITTATPATNGSGIATVGSWTLGAGGAGCSAAAITNCSRNTLHAVAASGTNPTLDFKGYVPPTVPATAKYQAVGNATLPVAANIGLLQNAFSINGPGANGTGATLGVTTPAPSGSQGGAVSIASDGSFSYLSSPAYVSAGSATENFTYAVSDGLAATSPTATLQINVPEHVWYVRPGYAGTPTGSDAQPYKDFSGSAGTGAEAVAAVNDTLLVQTGSGTATGGTLKGGQVLYGQGASVARTFTTGSAGTYRNGATTITLLAAGSAPTVGALALGSTNTLRGLTLAGTLSGTSFGTLTVSETSISASSQALSLNSGTLSGSFTSVTSSGGTSNISMTSVGSSGTFALGGGALSGASGDAFFINGGSATLTYAGSITNAATLAANIFSMTGGGVTLSGNINTTTTPGKGIAITGNSGGTFILSGAEIGISSGTANGVEITGNGAPATISLIPGTSLQIMTTTGIGFHASGAGTIAVTGASNAINAGAAAVSLSGVTAGAPGIAFVSTISTGGTNNVVLSSVGGTGTIALGTGALSGASGTAFAVSGGTTAVSYSGSVTKSSAGQLATVASLSGGSITLSGSLSCTSSCGAAGGAIGVTSNTGGTIAFSGSTKTLTPASGFPAVSLATNTGTTINFSNGGLAISTAGAGAGFSATGGGTLNVTGAGNTINAAGATALTLNAVTIGASNVAFSSVTSGGGTNNVNLSGLLGTNSVTLSGGALSGASGSSFLISSGATSISYGGTITQTSAARVVDVQGMNGGTVSITGAVSSTNGAGTGIFLSSNTGAAINFSGGIALTTNANAAFTASGGGTVAVTGTSNTLTTTTGVALSVANTTIGATGLTFRSISANGASNGIVLNTTGSNGGLTVTGGGANDHSGGTIQNTTGVGISLASTRNVSLTSMNIQSTAGSGIDGTGVTNFSFVNGTINNSGASGFQSNIAFNSNTIAANIVGTLTVTGSTLTNAYYSGVDDQSGSGTLSDANISNNTITSSTSVTSSLGIGVNLVGIGNASTSYSIDKAEIENNVITNFPSAAGIQVFAGNANSSGPAGHAGLYRNATDVITITGNLVKGASLTSEMGTSAIIYTISGGNTGARSQGSAIISSNGTLANPLANTKGTVILVGANGASNVSVTSSNNYIDAHNTVASNGIGGGTGVTNGTSDTPLLVWNIAGNHILDTDGNGILAVARGATGTLDLHIDNNSVAAPLSGVREGIRVDAGNASSVNDSVNLEASGNTSAGSGGVQGVGLRKQGTSTSVNAFSIQGLSPSPASTPTIENYVSGQNPSGGGVLLLSATSGFTTIVTVILP